MMATDITGEAVRLAQLGFDVFPLKVWSKLPANTHGFKEAVHDVSAVATTWARMPDANVAIRTGMYGDRCLVVVDLDEHHSGISGNDAWAEMCAVNPCPDTVECLTPSNGRHLYFWFPLEIRNSAGTLMPAGIDIRGEGGYVVAPPSALATDGVYQWESSSDPTDGVAIADAPQWLIDRLSKQPPKQEARRERTKYSGDPRPGDLWAAATTWPELLEADGAVYLETRTHTTHGNYETWARPGCMTDHGSLHVGATLYFGGSDVLKVHTSSWPKLQESQTYTKIGYLAATKFNGDHSAAARWCAEQGYRQPEVDMRDWLEIVHTPPHVDGGDERDPFFVDWPTFWTKDHAAEEWVVYPLIPAGRCVALYAPAKAGKSTIVLAAVAAAASGRPIFGGPPTPPRHVLYLDYEMTEADLAERLNELGYGPDDDLSHLHYALLPRIPDLDTAEGAKVICAIAAEVEAEVVVIDTIGRAVSGDENDAKTIQTFYRTTGKALKSAGRAWLRTDHSGKDVEKGQRGSSAKNDDVDVVWKLVRTDDGVLLAHNGVTRVSWVPEKIDLVRNESDDGVVSYKLRTGASWPAGTRECVDQLDRLGLPVDISKRKAAIALREAGLRVRNDVLNAAVRYRKQTLSHGVSNGDHLGDHPKTDMADWVTGTAGTTHQNTRSDGGDHLGDHRGPPLEDKWGPGPLSKEGTGHQPSTPNDWMTRLADKTSPPTPTPTIELDF